MRQRLGFINRATLAGWHRLVELSNHAAAAALVLLAVGVSVLSAVTLPHWWLGLLILTAIYAFLFAEGAFLIWREANAAAQVQHRGPFDSFELKRLWQFPASEGDEHYLILDFRYTNPQFEHRVNLDADLMWQSTINGHTIGNPRRFLRPYDQVWKNQCDPPFDVGPEGMVSGCLAFRCEDKHEVVRYGDRLDLSVTEGAQLFVRLTDHVSGETLDVPVVVPITPRSE
jgi:hypothetical protein